jgi:photosystem II stability/assembly factor-like uncharacterized protein
MKKLLLILAVIPFLFSDVYSQWVNQPTGIGTVSLASVNFVSATTGVAVGTGGTIIKTTNGGTTWVTKTSLTANALTSVRFISATNVIAVGQFGIILMSTNAGDTWTNQTTGTNLTSVHFPSATVGYAVGATGTVLKTTNGGVNWAALTSGTTVNLSSVYFTSATEGYIAGTGGNIRKTTNGGTNWTLLTSGTASNLNSIIFSSSATGWVCGTVSTMRKTTNSGTNWAAQTLSGGTTTMTCVNFIDANSGWATGLTGRINFTVNGGTNWITQTSPSANNLNSIFMLNSTTGWIVGDNGTVMKTTTGGLSAPTAPVLTAPANNSANIPVTPTFTWGAVSGATSYRIQISTVSNFAVIIDTAIVATNSYTIAAGLLQPATAYFWRVNASNAIGTSANSTTFNFSTVLNLPPVPSLVSPPNGQGGESLTPTLVWGALKGVTVFNVQVSTQMDFSVIVDSGSVPGSANQRVVPAGRLNLATNYFWRVRAVNSSGTGAWSSSFSFLTVAVGVNVISAEVPKEFKLFANYPNPFNPSTKIKFNMPKSEYATLKIYNSTGKLISEVFSNTFAAGSYEVEWTASNLSSGIYFYKLESASFTDTRRMILVK